MIGTVFDEINQNYGMDSELAGERCRFHKERKGNYEV